MDLYGFWTPVTEPVGRPERAQLDVIPRAEDQPRPRDRNEEILIELELEGELRD